jgi:hypothetical protein
MTVNEDKESSWEFDWRAGLPLVCLVAGVALILASVFLPKSALNNGIWSQEQAEKYQAASVKLHSLSHGSLHPSPNADPVAMRKELEQADQEYKAIRAQLDAALGRPKKLAWILRGVGVALMIVGGVVAHSMRGTA